VRSGIVRTARTPPAADPVRATPLGAHREPGPALSTQAASIKFHFMHNFFRSLHTPLATLRMQLSKRNAWS
jgi:hypothetical protein